MKPSQTANHRKILCRPHINITVNYMISYSDASMPLLNFTLYNYISDICSTYGGKLWKTSKT